MSRSSTRRPAQERRELRREPVGEAGRPTAPRSVDSTLPIPKAVEGPGLLASVVVRKYCDHLPLYRLEGVMSRHGVSISRQTMCGWLGPLADLVVPLTGLMRREVLLSHVIQTPRPCSGQADDTPVRMLGVREGGATGLF